MKITILVVVLLALLLQFVGQLAMSDGSTPVAVASYEAGQSAEVRGGYLVGVAMPDDPIHAFPERGTGNLNAEFVASKFLSSSWIPDFLLPRLRIGVMANLDGRTSYAYGGVLWTKPIGRQTFGEIFFGGLVHDGQLGNSNPRLARLGCRVLYQVGGNLGYRLSRRASVMLTYDHGSNGEPILSDCTGNEGIDVFGMRIGYSL